MQPYQLHWVRDPGLKANLAVACNGQKAAASAAELIVIVASPALGLRTANAQLDHVEGSSVLGTDSKAYYRKQIGMFQKVLGVGSSVLWSPIVALAALIRRPSRYSPSAISAVGNGRHAMPSSQLKPSCLAQPRRASIRARWKDFQARKLPNFSSCHVVPSYRWLSLLAIEQTMQESKSGGAIRFQTSSLHTEVKPDSRAWHASQMPFSAGVKPALNCLIGSVHKARLRQRASCRHATRFQGLAGSAKAGRKESPIPE
ncbi:hypothetical protein ALO78_200351 [Pseudomonas amygdali pv. ciccaronei]|nr:hypothetical protein ALO78_200351 [Pseudomonas amygdali pv. ciccaronei]